MSDQHHQASDEERLLLTSSPSTYDGSSAKQVPHKAHHNRAGLSPLRFRLICLSVWSCTLLGALDGTLVATLLTDIGSSFQASNQASWLGTAYLLSQCCFTPIYGRLSDLIGRRAAHLTAVTSFALGTALCAISPNMETLIFARCIQGIGGGGLQSVGAIIMTDLVDLRRRGLYQVSGSLFVTSVLLMLLRGMQTLLSGMSVCQDVITYAKHQPRLGGALGGPVGGYISDLVGWRTAFIVQLPLLAIAATLIFTQVRIPHPDVPPPPSRSRSGTSSPFVKQKPDRRANIARIDYLGSLTLVLAVGSLLISISFKTSSIKSSGDDYRWSDPLIWVFLVASAFATTAFILVEGYYAPEPILPLRMLTRRTPFAVALSSLTMVTSQFSILYNIPLYFSAVRLESASVAGSHVLPYSIMIGIGSLSIGWIIRLTGKYRWVTILSAVIIVASSVMLLTWDARSPAWITWIAQTGSGFGYAGVLTGSIVALMTNVAIEGKGET